MTHPHPAAATLHEVATRAMTLPLWYAVEIIVKDDEGQEVDSTLLGPFKDYSVAQRIRTRLNEAFDADIERRVDVWPNAHAVVRAMQRNTSRDWAAYTLEKVADYDKGAP